MTHRQVVLVSGPPGAGKTSVAVPLAEALGYPLLSKDTIKETLWDALRPDPGDLAASQRIGGAAMEVLWTLAGQCPQVVLEANFRPRSDYERRQVDRLGGRVVEVDVRGALASGEGGVSRRRGRSRRWSG